jgi:hypothetical protein
VTAGTADISLSRRRFRRNEWMRERPALLSHRAAYISVVGNGRDDSRSPAQVCDEA